METRPDALGRAAEIFEQVLARDPLDRAPFIRQACRDDAPLCDLLSDMLRAHQRQGDFLSQPTGVAEIDGSSAEFSPGVRAPASECPGTQIGPYRLLEQIGEGGFGTVYLAEQREPVQRRVALKIIKLGMDTKQVIARFEAERQALAMMDHPNIARVLDAGSTSATSPSQGEGRGEGSAGGSCGTGFQPVSAGAGIPSRTHEATGRPYFVMELIRGDPITRFCDDHNLTIPQRLGLFIDVCHAVQHAHQKGVIHRDLKPSNILVADAEEGTKGRRDEATKDEAARSPVSLRPSVPSSLSARVKIIDFGIAKALHERLTDKTVFTESRQLIGTPEYMSPEQAQMSDIDVDTRSDVYSLGILLYELLTGVTPFDRDVLRNSSFDDLRRIIREVDPPKPSTRVSSLAVASALRGGRLSERDVASAPRGGRLSEPLTPVRGQSGPEAQARDDSSASFAIQNPKSKIQNRDLRGDLDWIVMKCLEKDRTRRYETANGLAADVQRYLAGEPVLAAPPSNLYRLRKLLRRYRMSVAVAISFVLLVTGGLVTSLAYWQSARRERDRAVLAEKEESRERERAVAGERAATHEAERAQTVKALLDEMLEIPARRSPTGEELSFQEHLAGFAESLGQRLERLPEIEADVRLSVGKTYSLLAFYTEAEEQVRRALEIRRSTSDELDPEVSSALEALAILMRTAGRHNEGIRLFQDGVERARQVSEGDHETIAWRLSRLSRAQREAGDLPAAEAATREALGIRERLNGRNHPDVALSLAQLSLIFRTMGCHDDAIALARQAVEIDRATLGETDRTTTIHIEQLAVALRAAGHYQAAVDVWRDALRRAVEIHGDEHLAVAERMRQVAHFLFWIPDSAAEQATLFRTFLDVRRRLAPGEGEVLRRALRRTAEMHWLDGDLAAAEELLQDAADLLPRDRIEDNHIDTNVMLAVVLRDRGALEPAEAAMRKALRLEQDERPKRGRWFRGVMHYELAAILRMRGDVQEAAKQESQAAEIFQTDGPWYHLGYALRFEVIGRHMLNIGNYQSAADAFGWAVRMRAAICPGHRTHREAEELLKAVLAKLSVAPNGLDPDHPP